MSAFIGSVRAPHHNSAHDGAEVWCHVVGVTVRLFPYPVNTADRYERDFDPIAARNLAALLVRASEEVERMRDRQAREAFETS